jgi:pyruvate formate lyase activating enzyme
MCRPEPVEAVIFDVKRDCSEDGPGIRTTVFFAGCPLRCAWCQNPEGIDPQAPTGRTISLEELLYRVLVDKTFFTATGGGVTLSGGEPTLQMEFIHTFLTALRGEGVHTAIETCGQFDYERFSRLALPWLDLIYFDLKLADDEAGRKHTGIGNRLILENLTRLTAEAEVPVEVRVPLIPGITATRENLTALAHLVAELGLDGLTLLPYNPLWHDKLERLGRTPRYDRRTLQTAAEIDECIEWAREVAAKA